MATQKYRKRNTAATRRPIIDSRKRNLMMAIWLQNEAAFTAVRPFVTVDQLKTVDDGFALLWKVTCDLYDSQQKEGVSHGMPDREFIVAEIEGIVAQNSEALTEVEYEDLSALIEFAYDPAIFKKPINSPDITNWAINTSKQFVQERLAAIAREQLTVQDDTVPVDLPALMVSFQRQSEAVESIVTNDAAVAYPEGWDQEVALKIFATDLSFIDHFIGGGHAAGETYGLMGPYGSCKSTIGYMLAVKAANHFKTLTSRPDYDGVPMLSFMFSYEDPLKMMRQRSLGFAARILRRSLENMKSIADLSQPGNLLEYEKQLFRGNIAAGNRVLCEAERAVEAIKVMNQHLVFIDLTGADPTRKGAGGGGMAEAARIIDNECRKRKAKCGFALFDYVGAMAKRQITLADDLSNDDLRHLISGAPLEAKNRIAAPHDCPVWLLHQLNGEANNRSSVTVADHTDAAEARNFAENLDFSFSISRPSVENFAVIGCTKHRRQAGKDNTVIQIQGAMNRVVSVDATHVVDMQSRKIIKRSEMARIQDDTPAAPGAGDNTPVAASISESDLNGMAT